VLPAVSPYDTPTSLTALAEFRRMLERRVDFGRFDATGDDGAPMLLVGPSTSSRASSRRSTAAGTPSPPT